MISLCELIFLVFTSSPSLPPIMFVNVVSDDEAVVIFLLTELIVAGTGIADAGDVSIVVDFFADLNARILLGRVFFGVFLLFASVSAIIASSFCIFRIFSLSTIVLLVDDGFTTGEIGDAGNENVFGDIGECGENCKFGVNGRDFNGAGRDFDGFGEKTLLFCAEERDILVFDDDVDVTRDDLDGCKLVGLDNCDDDGGEVEGFGDDGREYRGKNEEKLEAIIAETEANNKNTPKNTRPSKIRAFKSAKKSTTIDTSPASAIPVPATINSVKRNITTASSSDTTLTNMIGGNDGDEVKTRKMSSQSEIIIRNSANSDTIHFNPKENTGQSLVGGDGVIRVTLTPAVCR
ncbi:hypothetical protein RirG_271790 [Rhizophagus irregularis DAOM 197198w]|uniref:Uncharacterized protein n=1 Tax=Rhizophagus irregularis (strain DAOM 197198w) TaxID=1432141 RepID=A0A015J5Y1_RHIIW|nr:hypothetical protein RirG_271790 [Rhizophagus irregularis DAOM 197198w]